MQTCSLHTATNDSSHYIATDGPPIKFNQKPPSTVYLAAANIPTYAYADTQNSTVRQLSYWPGKWYKVIQNIIISSKESFGELKAMCTLTHLVSFKKSIVSSPHKLARIKRCVNYVCKQRHVKQFVFHFLLAALCFLVSSLLWAAYGNQEGNELATFQAQSSDRSFVSFSVSTMVTHIYKVLVSQQNFTFPLLPCKQLHRITRPLFISNTQLFPVEPLYSVWCEINYFSQFHGCSLWAIPFSALGEKKQKIHFNKPLKFIWPWH